jgi:hypothetical protein
VQHPRVKHPAPAGFHQSTQSLMIPMPLGSENIL